jgi:IS5 family transposase
MPTRVLEDETLISAVYEALVRRSPKSRGVPSGPGRRGTPVEVVWRLLLLKHVRHWSYHVLEREVRVHLVYPDFTRGGASKAPDATTMGRWGLALGPETVEKIQERVVGIAKQHPVVKGAQDAPGYDRGGDQHPLPYRQQSAGRRRARPDPREEADRRDRRPAGDPTPGSQSGCETTHLGDRARTKGGPNRERWQQGYAKLLSAVGRVVGQAKRFSGEMAQGVKRSADVMQTLLVHGVVRDDRILAFLGS